MEVIEKIFTCTRCGFCCQGETTVSLDQNDRKRMAASLQISEEELEGLFLRRTADIVQMKTEKGHCIFYRDGCLVHDGRPWRCAQWPLVPALLNGEDNYRIISGSCPGINTDISYEQFCSLLKQYYRLHGTVIC